MSSLIDYIGADFGQGAGIKGCEYAPQRLRSLGIIPKIAQSGFKVSDCGDVISIQALPKENHINDGVFNLTEVVRFCNLLKPLVLQSYQNNHLALIIGGDHSIALGSLSATLQYDPNAAVIWFDAHTDINTETTSPSHNAHGMPLAAMLHLCTSALSSVATTPIKSSNIFYLGVRDIDTGEQDILQKHPAHIYTRKDILQKGINSILKEISIRLAQQNINTIHLSFDIDGLDPSIATATGTPVADGITVSELDTFCQWLPLNKIHVIDFVEYNPLLDTENITGKMCIETICKILTNNNV